MQNYFTLYTLFIKGDTKFWLVVLDKYKKLQPRHKGLTLILKYKSALLCCISLRCEYQIPKKFCFPFHRKIDKFLVNKPSASLISVPLSPAPPRPTKSRVGHRQTDLWATEPFPDSSPANIYTARPWHRLCYTWLNVKPFLLPLCTNCTAPQH